MTEVKQLRELGEFIGRQRTIQAVVVRIVPEKDSVTKELLVQEDTRALPAMDVPLYRDNHNTLGNNSDFFNKIIGIEPVSGIREMKNSTPDKNIRVVYYLAKEELSDEIGNYKWIPLEEGRHLLPQTDPEFLQKISTDWRDDQ